MRGELTETQAKVLEYMRGHLVAHQRLPKVRDTMRHFGWKSPNCVMGHLKAMVKKKWLKREERETHGYYQLAGVKVVLRDEHEAHQEGVRGAVETRPDGDVPRSAPGA